jgi:hypothetical protein
VYEKEKRKQLVNDLMSLSKHTCPFLVEWIGAIYTEGCVKFALELMDMGSLGNI